MTTFLEKTLANGETFYAFKDGSGMLPGGDGIREFVTYESDDTEDMDDVIPPGRVRQAFLLFRKWVNSQRSGSHWYLPELAFYPDGCIELLDDTDVSDEDVEHGPVLQSWKNANEARIWFQNNT